VCGCAVCVLCVVCVCVWCVGVRCVCVCVCVFCVAGYLIRILIKVQFQGLCEEREGKGAVAAE